MAATGFEGQLLSAQGLAPVGARLSKRGKQGFLGIPFLLLPVKGPQGSAVVQSPGLLRMAYWALG